MAQCNIERCSGAGSGGAEYSITNPGSEIEIKSNSSAGEYVSFTVVNPAHNYTIIGDTTNNVIPYASGNASSIFDTFYFVMPAENVHVEYTQ